MLRNYLLTAWKVFGRRKLFTAVNLLCIVLTLVVLMVATALLEFAFFPSGVEGKSDRMLEVAQVRATMTGKPGAQSTSTLGYKLAARYLLPLKTPELVSILSAPISATVYEGDQVQRLMMRHVDANYWKILDFRFLAGRAPTADDDKAGRMVAVINASTAVQLFGQRDAVGKRLTVSGQTFQVIGVVEDAMQINAFSDIWVPISTYPNTVYQSQMIGEFWVLILAHSRADIPAIQAEVQRVSATVQFDDPTQFDRAWMWADSKLDFFARGLFENAQIPESGASTLVTRLVLVALLFMLLPALNLVNLNAGRIMERSSEIGVRKAFGATNGQLVAQFVFENVLLCVAGGLIALLCAEGILLLIGDLGLIPYLKLNINFTVFLCGLLLASVFGVLSGVLPALKMARLDPVHALKGAA